MNKKLPSNSMAISILGCGWLGERIGKTFLKKGWTIHTSSRKEIRLKELANFGFQPFQIDIENTGNIPQEFFDTDYLIIATTNKNSSAHRNLFKIIQNSRIRKVFFISSTSVYEKAKNVITVNTPLVDSPLVEVEKVYLTSKISCILRCGGLIGDNRQPGSFFKKGATIKNPDGIVNLIHYEEIILAVNSLIKNDNKQVIHNLTRESQENRFEYYSRAYRELHGESGEFI